MLVALNSYNIQEIATEYAKSKQKYVLVVDNTKWFTLDASKQATVKTYYEDVIPADEIVEIFKEKYIFYAFDTQVIAVDNANDWFPQNTDLTDQDYFIDVYVITPAGSIPYTNYIPPQS